MRIIPTLASHKGVRTKILQHLANLRQQIITIHGTPIQANMHIGHRLGVNMDTHQVPIVMSTTMQRNLKSTSLIGIIIMVIIITTHRRTQSVFQIPHMSITARRQKGAISRDNKMSVHTPMQEDIISTWMT